jgi:23S rRNA pseudouridine2605 synthase
MRLNQFLARAGLGSRRSVEALIRSGRIKVNGFPAGLAIAVDPAGDAVTLDDRPLTLPADFTYIVLHKPAGFTVTRRDPRARRTVYELLPPPLRKLAYVGRLDRESEGVLLFTDDGELTHRLLRPEYGLEREYHIDPGGEIPPASLAALKAGTRLPDGYLVKAEKVRSIAGGGSGVLVDLVICEGKKREVRLMCRAAGIPVARLVRVRFGPVRLGRLAPGRHRPLAARELEELRKSASRRKKPLSQSPAEK